MPDAKVVRISNENWTERVRRVAARTCNNMGEATKMQRENGVKASPSEIIRYNPTLKVK